MVRSNLEYEYQHTIYEQPLKTDGTRILVDRIWARGIKKEQAAIDEWIKELAPSTELRKWFSHDETKWEQFKKRYHLELDKKSEAIKLLKKYKQRHLTLVYAAKDSEHNNAAALKEYLDGIL